MLTDDDTGALPGRLGVSNASGHNLLVEGIARGILKYPSIGTVQPITNTCKRTVLGVNVAPRDDGATGHGKGKCCLWDCNGIANNLVANPWVLRDREPGIHTHEGSDLERGKKPGAKVSLNKLCIDPFGSKHLTIKLVLDTVAGCHGSNGSALGLDTFLEDTST